MASQLYWLWWGQSEYNELVMKPGKHQRNKQRCQDFCWKVLQPCTIFCFALIHSAWITYVTTTFLLVSSSARSFVQGQGQKSEQKSTTKNLSSFIWLWWRWSKYWGQTVGNKASLQKLSSITRTTADSVVQFFQLAYHLKKATILYSL